MSKIISLFIKFLNRINKFIWKIIIFLSKFIKIDEINHLDDKPKDIKYRLFNVDVPAILEPFVTTPHKDYKQLIKANNIKPIKRHNGKTITIDVKCPCCGAPKDYLYDNTGKQNQFECKVCYYIFSIHSKGEDVVLKCPYCRYQLNLCHHREDFDVYRCPNNNCPFYLKNKSSLNVHDKKLYQEHPEKIKLRYIYRKFNVNDNIIMYKKYNIKMYKNIHSFCYTFNNSWRCNMREVNKLRQELMIMRTLEIKPNYSELARIHDCDRRTIKRYDEVVVDLYDNKSINEKTFDRITGWDNKQDKQKDDDSLEL